MSPASERANPAGGHWPHDLLDELGQTHFYAALEVKFEAGRVVFARRTETLKPPEGHNRDSRGCSHDPTDK